MDKVREMALKALYKIEKENAYSNIVLDEIINKSRDKLSSKDIGLLSELIYGVTTWRLTIDEIIKKHSKIKIKKISPWILNILRIGAYQIIFLDKIPKSAAVNEGVELAKKYGNKGSIGFSNAILRKITRKDYEEFFNIQDDSKRISLTTSMPLWIVQKLLEQKSLKQVEEICKFSNERPNLTIRINTLKTNKEELKNKLKNHKISFKETDEQDFLILEKQKNIENLDLFQKGYFTIQDLSAGLAAITLNPKQKQSVLDCCSAPGGKTTYMAELMNNNGQIEAWDIYEHRKNLVEQNAKRLGINIIKTKQDYTEKFDKILLDVPCLGLGVIKRKPDIKWQRKVEDIEKISKIQLDILEVCSKYLKKGGELVYSTCSILKEENEDIISTFLSKNPEFKKDKTMNISTSKNWDGFFICKLSKNL